MGMLHKIGLQSVFLPRKGNTLEVRVNAGVFLRVYLI